MGAIGFDQGCIHFRLFRRSVDRWKFLDWLDGFKNKVGKKRCYLYMDNLSVHKTEEVSRQMELYNIEPIFSPAYSPDYNPIEYMFSKLKGIVRRMRL